MYIEHIRCNIHRYTFKVKKIKDIILLESIGKVLNLFCGFIKLGLNEIRNDKDKSIEADYHLDAFDFVREWKGNKFDTVILDPPYSYRKSMELYNGHKNSRFKLVKDGIPAILNEYGKVITLGYQSINMGKGRGFELEHLYILSHGGAIHDTLLSVERKLI